MLESPQGFIFVFLNFMTTVFIDSNQKRNRLFITIKAIPIIVDLRFVSLANWSKNEIFGFATSLRSGELKHNLGCNVFNDLYRHHVGYEQYTKFTCCYDLMQGLIAWVAVILELTEHGNLEVPLLIVGKYGMKLTW